MKNLHIISIKYSNTSASGNGKILIRSERFKKTKSIPYNHDCGGAFEGGIDYLQKQGFELIGQAEGKNCYLVISTTFKNL